jgi:hypothetical protein
MKAIARTIVTVAATLLIAALPVLADEGMMGQQQDGSTMGQQEESVNSRECLLVAQNCPTEALQSRAQRIQTEMNRGTDVYTKEEMRQLQKELEEIQREIGNDFDSGGA